MRAHEPAKPIDAGSGLEIRSSLTPVDLLEIEAIQREVWGSDDVVPVTQLRAVAHAGGQLSAAYHRNRMVGFAYAFLAEPHGRGMSGPGLHSHMVAVRSEGRGLGIGRRLKWHQRELAIRRGYEWISWTFDPLQAANARFNLEHLGAVSLDYLTDFYGVLDGPLGGGQSSDRLMALWLVNSERVRERLIGPPTPPTDNRSAAHRKPASNEAPAWAVREDERPTREGAPTPAGEPKPASVPEGATEVRVAVPANITRLFEEDPALASRWRTTTRDALSRLLGAGYAVMGFEQGAYILSRDTKL